MTQSQPPDCDILVIGGGINGCGIARDAAGRGLSVILAEQGDLAQATSSASTKLFHGGLRYLEYFEFRLVREALAERETLLRAMPHISWPLRFVLPLHPDMRFEGGTPTSRLLGALMPWTRGRRPDWLIRLGLFLYDHLGGRGILPGTRTLDLRSDPAGVPLKASFEKGFEYSDCWVQDSRLVVLNARDAEARGAEILTRTRVTEARRDGELWRVTLTDSDTGLTRELRARALVNAGGPWVAEVIRDVAHQTPREAVRLVRGSHIVVNRITEDDRAYFFQGSDGRIIFAIPYEQEFTLIGTTDADHPDPDTKPEISAAERDYLIDFANGYLEHEITRDDIVWTYSGVRPLYDDGSKSPTAATRDYVLSLNTDGPAPLLNIFGGKITTYRRLAEAALAELAPFFPAMAGDWTAGMSLPGGDFAVEKADELCAQLGRDYPFLGHDHALRLFRCHGTEAWDILGQARSHDDLGRAFGAGLSEAELRWLMTREYARDAEDVVWRRTRLGLRMSADEIAEVDAWMKGVDRPAARG
ncbi:glycerol-3-phosphate dehydrogenase [Roseovarius sp. SCSIO 43702]|uniref:glycerol-3-phosphate dehydrogenase n=1 Tax=Roseovarius sp. SCSIO 43702 TaxID=2823043 RepID=UPI001C72F652|nr:glycerol-3-phosphate dehydrogenase [Roseovarius sp. SCSIO 43702]QYX56765.1 glycerol-3-phosphate dehydrogenase [Roseovarius sp. SCSIO 43702]